MENISDHITIADLGLDSEKYEVMHLEPATIICSAIGAIMAEEPAEDEGSTEEQSEKTEGEE